MVRRPALAPGTRLTRHDALRLRIGSRPGVVVDDSALLRAVVAAIDGVQDRDVVCAAAAEAAGCEIAAAGSLLDDLVGRGAVVEAEHWIRCRAPRDEVAAAVLRDRDPVATSARARTVLAVHAGPGCHDLADLVRLGARIGGVAVRDDRPPHVIAVVTVGEPHRDTIESLVGTGAAVLPVVLDEGRCVAGPWIVAGRTPCLRCADHARAWWSSGWAGHWPSLDRSDRPHAVGVELAQSVAALVVSDVLAACDRQPVRTVGARLTIGPEPTRATRLAVAFHPDCPCHLLTTHDGETPVS